MATSPASTSTAAIPAANSASGYPSGNTGILDSSSGCSNMLNAAAANSAEPAAMSTTRALPVAASPPTNPTAPPTTPAITNPPTATARPRTTGWVQRRGTLSAPSSRRLIVTGRSLVLAGQRAKGTTQPRRC